MDIVVHVCLLLAMLAMLAVLAMLAIYMLVVSRERVRRFLSGICPIRGPALVVGYRGLFPLLSVGGMGWP